MILGALSYGYLMGILWVSYGRPSKNLGNWSFIGLQMPYNQDISKSYSIEKRNRQARNRPNERFLVYCCAVYRFCETFISLLTLRLFEILRKSIKFILFPPRTINQKLTRQLGLQQQFSEYSWP